MGGSGKMARNGEQNMEGKMEMMTVRRPEAAAAAA